MNANKILLFSRRSHYANRFSFSKLLFPASEINLWSDEKLGGEKVKWWGKWFYEEIEKSHGDRLNTDLLDEMIIRCRYLRVIPRAKALILAEAAYFAWKRILLENNYDFVIHQPIDSFVLDALERSANDLGIPSLHPTATMLTGALRFTSRGEVIGRVPDQHDEAKLQEIESFMLKENFKPDWLFGADSPAKSTILKRTFIDTAKIPAYALYRLLSQDAYSFSFAKHKYQRGRMFGTLDRYFTAMKMERVSVKSLPSEFVFIPLQFYPEASTDYWIPETAMINHHKNVLSIAKAISKEIPVLIKEHPIALGRRPAAFMKELFSLPNVFLAPTLSPAGQIVKKASLVVGHGSSSMFQAMIMQRPVMFLGTPYYGSENRCVLKSVDDSVHIQSQVEKAIKQGDTTVEEYRNVIKRMINTTAEGKMGNYAPIGEKNFVNTSGYEVSEKLHKLLQSSVADLFPVKD